MTFRKYQKVEDTSVLSPQEHQALGKELRRMGKASMRDLDNEQREQVTDALDDDANSTGM
jgi:hypothetical protein